jgi:hypothetical protein
MSRRTVHNATITLKLPFDMGTGAKVAALRAAGIPVDAEGNEQQGFLFVRSSDGLRGRTNIFRWFAGDEVGRDPRDAGSVPPHHERSAAPSPSSDTLDHWLARALSDPIRCHEPALQCELDYTLIASQI